MRKYGFITVTMATCTLSSLAEPKLDIFGWGYVPPKFVDAARYEEAAEAGFTVLMQWVNSIDHAKELLDLAQQKGLKLQLQGNETRTPLKDLVAATKGHPALHGFTMADEPAVGDFAKVKAKIESLRAIDPDKSHVYYVNVFGPVQEPEKWCGTPTYEEYLEKVLSDLPLDLFSFTCYPVRTASPMDGESFRNPKDPCIVLDRWYDALEKISAQTKAKGLPFWGFALATAHRVYPGHDFPVPTMGHLRLEAYSNLAYGAQGLQYFTYWNVAPGSLKFNNPPFTGEGKSAPVYDRMRALNHELKAREFVFAGAKVRGVRHTGTEIPMGTKPLTTLPKGVKSLATPDGGAVVSILENDGKLYLVVVNRSPNDEMTLDIELEDGAERVREDGTIMKAAAHSTEYWLAPGACEIFRLP